MFPAPRVAAAGHLLLSAAPKGRPGPHGAATANPDTSPRQHVAPGGLMGASVVGGTACWGPVHVQMSHTA